jgi:hypothetical protein
MARQQRSTPASIHEIFADMALLMLATFVFLLVMVLILFRFSHDEQVPDLLIEIEQLQARLEESEQRQQALEREVERLEQTEGRLDEILDTLTVGRKDFDLFIQGLRDLPGQSVHLVVDASGSMHGLSSFLVPILRHVVMRAGKRLDALTWFVDNRAETYTGSMPEVLDRLVSDAPFAGNQETIGAAFRYAANNAPKPGAYMLIGDEPSVDKIYYPGIPAPVFTLPLGRAEPRTEAAFREIAEQTGGRMLMLDFK